MDQLIKGVIKDRAIRVYLVNSTLSCKEICSLHNTSPVASDALSRLVSVGAMMSGMIKLDGRLTLKISGNGPLKQLLVDATVDGKVRGFVANPQIDLPLNKKGQLDVGKAVGDLGVLTVIKHMGLKQDFTGDVILTSGEIGDDFCYYFAKSEQTPSSVIVGTKLNENGDVIASGGIIIQMLPNASEEDIVYAEQIVQHLGSISELIYKENDIEKLAKTIFNDIHGYEVSPIKFECNCSKERFIAGIATLPAKDINEMISEEHGCEVRCEFCNKVYKLTEEDLKVSAKMKVDRAKEKERRKKS